MSEGWKQGEVEDDHVWLLHTPDGRTFRDTDLSITEDQYKRMYQGYTCAWCGEVWPQQWPKECTLVGCWSPKPMSEQVQRRYLEERFAGEKWFGISKKTLERLQEDEERAAWKKRVGIWVP